MEKTPQTIAIIGFGRFGKLLTKILLNNSQADLIVIDKQDHTSNHKRLSFVDLKKVAASDLVIPCVPISAFEKVILQTAPLLKKSAVVMDICSVKVLPVRIMKKHLPKNIQIIASHPMFGPDAFRINKGLKNLKMVLHNVSAAGSTFSNIKSFFKQIGLDIIEITPEEHDRFLAWSLGYSYLIGKISQRLKLTETPIDTLDFNLLLQNMEIIKRDSEELFMDMQINNPFAEKVHRKFIKVTEKILGEIRLKKKKGSV